MKVRMLAAVLLVLLVPTVAIAQSTNPVEQRIAAHIGALTIQNTALVLQVEQLTAENAKLKAEIEELKKAAAK